MIKLNKHNQKVLGLLLTPSWLSGLAAVFIGLFITVGVITAFTINNSTIQQQLVSWQQSQPEKPLTTPDQVLVSDDKPTLGGSWPLLVVWTVIGLIVYGIAASIVNSLSNAEELREELGYVHARPQNMIWSVAGHLALRIVAATLLVIFIILFFEEVVPYSITAAHACAADALSGSGALYGFLSFFIVVVSLHLQTIFLRLTVGRVRVLSS